MKYHLPPFYEKGSLYEQWQYTCLYDLLAIPVDTPISMLDLGAGTGRTAELLFKKYGQSIQITCVDNSQGMLDQIEAKTNITIINNDFIEYIKSTSEQKFDSIIIKEAIHFIPDNECFYEFCQNAYRSLKNHGSLVVCTRPKIAIQYPLSKRLLAKWEESQESIELYVEAFENAGFKVTVKEETFLMQTSFTEWKYFLESRVWSIFSKQNLADAQLAEEIVQIEQKYFKNNQDYTFEEKLILLQCVKIDK